MEFDLELMTEHEKETVALIDWAMGQLMQRIITGKVLTGSEERELAICAMEKDIVYKSAHNRKYIQERNKVFDLLPKSEKKELQKRASEQILAEQAIRVIHEQITCEKEGRPYVHVLNTHNA